jgi:DNA invertase Pin-like site-specific DNA recombinase
MRDVRGVAYLRVSTAAVLDLARARGLTLLAEFTEVESGKRNGRPELARALHHAKVTGAVLVIAKLDRLSRNAGFLLTLRDSGVRFIAADIPDANDLTIGVLAVIAQAEREAISRRTKEALAVVRARLKAEGTYTSPRSGRTVRHQHQPGA